MKMKVVINTPEAMIYNALVHIHVHNIYLYIHISSIKLWVNLYLRRVVERALTQLNKVVSHSRNFSQGTEY